MTSSLLLSGGCDIRRVCRDRAGRTYLPVSVLPLPTSQIGTSPGYQGAPSMTLTSTHEHVTMTSKGFRLRTYEPAPAGFDPRRATERELLHHGLPRRPDGDTEAPWRAVWDKALARPRTWIVPEFSEVPDRTH